MSKHGWSLELVQMEFRRFLHAIVLLPAPMVRSEMVLLERGDSWVVPKGARHSYRILETFTAVRSDQPTGRSTRSQRIGRNNPQIDRWIVKSVSCKLPEDRRKWTRCCEREKPEFSLTLLVGSKESDCNSGASLRKSLSFSMLNLRTQECYSTRTVAWQKPWLQNLLKELPI
jgi:hypothetical protein